MVENNFYNNETFLNIANYYIGTQALGPGLRSVVWVQGCPFHCPMCYSASWIPQKAALLFQPEDLAEILTADPKVSGVTISGGEPLLQARLVIRLIDEIKKIKPHYTLILYTGFKREKIILLENNDPKRRLITLIDVLIDGFYINGLNNNLGLRGSTNQNIWYMTDRLRNFDFETLKRENEIIVKDGEIHFIGVPDSKTMDLPSQLEKVNVWA